MGLSGVAGPEAGIASVRQTGVSRTLRFEGGITLKIEDILVRKPLSDWVITSEAIRQGFPTPFKTPYATNRGVSLLRAYEGFRTWLKRGLLKATGILPGFYAPDAPAEIADAKRWRWAAFGYADLCSFRLAKNLLDAGLPWDTVNPIVSDYTLWQSHQANDSDGRHLVIHAGGTEWGIYTTKSLIDQLDSETRKRDWAILIDLRDLRKDVVLRCRAASLKAVATRAVQPSELTVH